MGFEDIVQEVCQVTNLLAVGVQEDRSLKESFFPFLFLVFFFNWTNNVGGILNQYGWFMTEYKARWQFHV